MTEFLKRRYCFLQINSSFNQPSPAKNPKKQKGVMKMRARSIPPSPENPEILSRQIALGKRLLEMMTPDIKPKGTLYLTEYGYKGKLEVAQKNKGSLCVFIDLDPNDIAHGN
ncbi:hypothetical protein C4546_00830 [Candidatus Parcubacteria bacterium]|nr:MAG: hypothetical protein C4546_00830 [Candidatus Parcubacteria bacterium]